MRLRFTRKALKELDEILAYISVRSPGGSLNVQHRLRMILNILSERPNIGRLTSNPRMRRIVVTPYPYLVFYEVVRDELVIIGFRHAARDPSSMPDQPKFR